MSETEETSDLKKVIGYLSNATLLVGLVTITGYYLAYQYQKGYISFYKLDELFVTNISITNVMAAIVTIFSFITFLIPTFGLVKNMVLPRDIKKENVDLRSFLVKHILVIPILIGYTCNVFFNLGYIPCFMFMGVYIFIFLVPSLVSAIFNEDENSKTYKDKLKKTIAENDIFSLENIVSQATKSIINMALVFLAFVIVVTTFAHFMGFNSASSKKAYQLVEYNNLNYVIITLHGEDLFMASYDREKNEIETSYKIIKAVSSIEDDFSMEYIKLDKSPTVIESD